MSVKFHSCNLWYVVKCCQTQITQHIGILLTCGETIWREVELKRGRFDRFSPILYFNLLYLGERITSQSLKGQTDAFSYCYIVSSWNLLTERHSKIRSRVIKLFCLSIHRMCPNHSFFEYELTGRLCICENPSQSYGDYMYMHVFGCFKQGRTCVCVIVFQRGHPEEKVDSWI